MKLGMPRWWCIKMAQREAEVAETDALKKRITELEAMLKDADEAHDEIQGELSAQVAENKRLKEELSKAKSDAAWAYDRDHGHQQGQS